MSWLEVLLQNLRALWPWWWVQEGERGVFYKRGKPQRELGSGVHFAFWWFNQIKIEKVAVDTLNIPTLSETTSDGQEVAYSANFIYEVDNLIFKQTKVQDFQESLQNLVMIHLGRVIRKHDYNWIRDNRDKIERRIRKIARIYASRWGVRIHEVGITDFVRPQQIRHMGDVILHA
jgi:regulator of protease activity HflC (stomatin/prohibitin superfamily)